ncbi:MAG: hypothetical protein H0W33_13295 [Gammaproteobacteria bacterium]|nr:hypothetical protein [Gammaproteobacteria bacterium]
MATMPRDVGNGPEFDGADEADETGYYMDEDDWGMRSREVLRRFRDQEREDRSPRRKKYRRRDQN